MERWIPCAHSKGTHICDDIVKDFFAKAYHAILRASLKAPLSQAASAAQCGGIDGRGADIASWRLCQTQLYLIHSGISYAILFVDVKAAFDTLCRDIVFQGSAELPYGSSMHNAGVDPVAARLAVESHTGTWFSLRGSGQTSSFTRGCQQGDPLGDITYNIFMAHLLKVLRAELELQGLLTAVTCKVADNIFDTCGEDSVDKSLTDVSYLDDLAIFITADMADQLIHRIRRVMQVVLDTYDKFNTELNLGPNKTALVVRFAGRGARQQRQHLAHDLQGSLPVPHRDAVVHVPIVVTYKHLGRVVAADGRFAPEAKNRAKDLWRTLAKEQRSFFRNVAVPQQKRLQVLRAIILSKVMYGAGTWSTITDEHCRVLQRPVLQALRAIGGYSYRPQAQMLSDEEVMQALSFPSIQALVMCARARFFARLMRHPSDGVRTIVQRTRGVVGSWAHTVLANIAVIRFFSPQLQDMPDPRSHAGRWETFVKSFPAAWKTIISRFTQSPGLLFGLADQGEAAADGEFLCVSCGFECPSLVGLAMHRRQRHAVIAPQRLRAQGSVCRVCRLDFGTRPRLMAHWRRTPKCWSVAMMHDPPMPIDLVAQLDEADKTEARLLRARGLPPRFAGAPPRRVVP